MSDAYLRYPHLHADQLVFCAADDLWVAPVAGGRASRLTSDTVPVKYPRFSPDGRQLAWTSTRDGQWDVMVMDLDSYQPRRLTYWGNATTRVLGWTGDGRVLVASSAGEDNLRHVFAKAVDLDGRMERLRYGPVSGVAVHPDGPVVVATPGSREPAAWKRYRGGTAAKLWLDRAGDGADYERLLPELTAGLVAPLWIGDRLLFASDHEADLPGRADAQANLFSLQPLASSAELTRHTHHTVDQGYVRDPASDGERVVYHARGALYLLPELSAEPMRIEVSLGAPAPGRRPRLLTPTENLTDIRPDHGADGSLVAWRGNAYHLSHREGPARALAADSAIRIREPRALGDTAQAILVSDAAGEDRLEVHAFTADVPVRVLAAGQLGRVLHLEPNRAGDQVAGISHDGRVWVLSVDSGDVRQVGRSREGEAVDLAFSPDGRYLVWSQPMNPLGIHSQLRLVDLSDPTAESVALTDGRFADFSPSFTVDGKYLAFLSARTFDPNYDTHVFNLMFSSAVRPYLIPLASTTPAPFGPSADGWRLSKAKEADERAKTDTVAAAAAVVSDPVDLDGFEERILPFAVAAGNYRDLRAAAKGVLWIRERPVQGVLGSSRSGVQGDEPADVLECFDFEARKLVTLVDRLDSYALSGDGQRVVVRDRDSVLVLPADRQVKPDDSARVEVDLGRLRFELDPAAEWRQMFEENARLMRDHYWRADLDGIEWESVLDPYRPIVDALSSHDDLVDLLWETVAELNTSHAYVMPRQPPGDQSRRVGLLGADLSPVEGGGWRIDKILPGESSDPDARSPLRAAGIGAAVGDLILAVDGRALDPRLGPGAALTGAADKPVEITLRPADGSPDRRVVVLPLADEEPLRYQAWVAGRRDYVRQASGGRLGYLHIPDMAGPGWAQIHRDIDVATRHEGLIVDVRYNRGGHTSQLVIERLARKVLGWTTARHYASQEDYPHQSARGPVIFVANEWSGSDGDIVNAAAQAMGLGPVVGVRTWGGVVGIDGRFELVDGTGVTQPRYAFWLKGYGWGVENHGIDPDIEVVVSPADWYRPEDVQLDRAVAEALDRLARTPAAEPPAMPPPRVRR
ncbi:S41 family peptidase [Microlunatus panaciterrae]|uniref:Tricorn protease homolog n=1 Tax=Microlunatus panaciterrae TaxID=400768 RepID=A0ABS2RNK2_9ACTN|nr:S41 family peptidase [Microlunatus panaciterrae]MBM7800142.1 tricorn protease [Microlunatus panaciterrae]